MCNRIPDRDTRVPREYRRTLQPWLHREGWSATNLQGDCALMLNSGLLNDKDARHLEHVLRACLHPDPKQPDGLSVTISGREFGSFIGARRRYQDARGQRLFSANQSLESTPNHELRIHPVRCP